MGGTAAVGRAASGRPASIRPANGGVGDGSAGLKVAAGTVEEVASTGRSTDTVRGVSVGATVSPDTGNEVAVETGDAVVGVAVTTDSARAAAVRISPGTASTSGVVGVARRTVGAWTPASVLIGALGGAVTTIAGAAFWRFWRTGAGATGADWTVVPGAVGRPAGTARGPSSP